jgi:DNA-binding response OmpR family regulator
MSRSCCSSFAAAARRSPRWSDALATDATVHHVLVADDEPHIGRIIKMKLEQGPFRVTLAYDGVEALEALEREPDIAIVLLDLMMPRVSGLDVLAHIRGNERYAALPCIILTAAGQEQQYRAAMALGASEFMTKPFSPKRLYARTAQLVGIADDAAPEIA